MKYIDLDNEDVVTTYNIVKIDDAYHVVPVGTPLTQKEISEASVITLDSDGDLISQEFRW